MDFIAFGYDAFNFADVLETPLLLALALLMIDHCEDEGSAILVAVIVVDHPAALVYYLLAYVETKADASFIQLMGGLQFPKQFE